MDFLYEGLQKLIKEVIQLPPTIDFTYNSGIYEF